MKMFVTIIVLAGLGIGGYYAHENYRPEIDPAYAVEAYLNAVDRTEDIAADLADRQAWLESRAEANRQANPIDQTQSGTFTTSVDPYDQWHDKLRQAKETLEQDAPEWQPAGKFANVDAGHQRDVSNLTRLAPVKSDRKQSIFESSRRFRVLGSTYDGRRRRIRQSRNRRPYYVR